MQINTLVELMRSIPEEEREIRRLEMDKVWLKYTYQRPPQEGDAFHMLLRGERCTSRSTFNGNLTRSNVGRNFS